MPGQVVDEALGRRVLELPDEPDDGQRQHDGHVQDALVEAGATDLLVKEDSEENPDRRRDEQEEPEPQQVVLEGGPERLVLRQQVDVVGQADGLDIGDAADPVPTCEREKDGQDDRQPDEDEGDQ